jgi:hypothetical protein
MTLPWDEEWVTGFSLGNDPTVSSNWTAISGGAGTSTIVDSPAFDTGIRSYSHLSTTSYGGRSRSWTSQSAVYLSFYYYHTVTSGTGNQFIGIIRNGTNSGAQLRKTSASKFQLRNNTSNAVASTMNCNESQWYRLDWKVDKGNTTQSLAIFTGSNLHGTTPDETISGTYNQTGDPNTVVFGSAANADGIVATQLYSYIRARSSAFAAPYVDSSPVPLATPTGFTFVATPGLRELTANWTPVEDAGSYEVNVEYLSGTDPAEDSDWSFLVDVVVADPPAVVDDSDGVTWNESYRGRVTALVDEP